MEKVNENQKKCQCVDYAIVDLDGKKRRDKGRWKGRKPG